MKKYYTDLGNKNHSKKLNFKWHFSKNSIS